MLDDTVGYTVDISYLLLFPPILNRIRLYATSGFSGIYVYAKVIFTFYIQFTTLLFTNFLLCSLVLDALLKSSNAEVICHRFQL